MSNNLDLEDTNYKKIAFLFPDEASFYRKMGIEIYENYKEAEEVFKIATKVAKIQFESLLMYEHEPYYWDDTDKKIAVLASSVSLYRVFRTTCKIVPSVLWGKNTGYLAALVCEEVISLKNAIQFIQGKQPSSFHIKKIPEISVYGDGKETCSTKKEVVQKIEAALIERTEIQQLMDCLVSSKIRTVIEIGPNNLIYQQLEKQTDELRSSYLDKEDDCNWVLENIIYKKFFNRLYAMKRMLGQVVSTKLDGGKEEGQQVFTIYSELKNMIDQHKSIGQQDSDVQISDEEYEECYQLMIENFEVKKTPEAEIKQRLRMLEQETLLSFGRKEKGGTLFE